MELSKRSELSVSGDAYVVETGLAGDATPVIQTKVISSAGKVLFETSLDISSLKPIFQNSQKVSTRLEAQHQAVMKRLEQGNIPTDGAGSAESSGGTSSESQALQDALGLLSVAEFDRAASAFRALLEQYPNCNEGRELLEVTYKAASGARLPVDTAAGLKKGTDAFANGKQRDAIEAWKSCLVEEPSNRRLQLLVLLATTWSAERRQSYAREVLAPEKQILASARPEEAQALLLIAQTVENDDLDETSAGGLESLVETPPPPTAAPASMPPAKPVRDEPVPIIIPAPPEPTPLATAPPVAPPVTVEPKLPSPPPAPALPPDPPPFQSNAAPPPPSATLPRRQAPPPAAPVPTPAPKQQAPSPVQIAPDHIDHDAVLDALTDERDAAARSDSHTVEMSTPVSTDQPGPEPAAASAPTTSSRPAMSRRPMPAPRRPPWGLIAGVGVGVLLAIGAVMFFLSGGSSVPPERLEEAANFLGSGQYQQAIAAYDTILQEFGDDASIFLGRARARIATADVSGGLSDLQQAHELDPSSSAITEEIGDVYFSQGDALQAIGFYKQAIDGGGASVEGRYRLGVSLVQLERGDEALTHLEAAISSDPTHGEAQFLYGQLLNARRRHAEAEKALRAAEPNLDAGGDYFAELGIALLEQEKLDAAEEIARAFIQAYPQDARSRALLGEVYLNRRQFEPARAQLIQALRTDPRQPRAQIALGRSWLAIGRTRGDARDLAKARQVLTTAEGVDEGARLLALGQVSLAEGNLDDARNLLAQSLRHGAPQLPVHLSLAEAKTLGDDLAGAAEELQAASGLAPEDPSIPLSLGIVYSQLDESDRAGEQFLKAIQGAGLMEPPGPDAGPVVLPGTYVPLPERFNLNRAIRDAYRAVLSEREEDPTATELQRLAESTTFVLPTN